MNNTTATHKSYKVIKKLVFFLKFLSSSSLAEAATVLLTVTLGVTSLKSKYWLTVIINYGAIISKYNLHVMIIF